MLSRFPQELRVCVKKPVGNPDAGDAVPSKKRSIEPVGNGYDRSAVCTVMVPICSGEGRTVLPFRPGFVRKESARCGTAIAVPYSLISLREKVTEEFLLRW